MKPLINHQVMEIAKEEFGEIRRLVREAADIVKEIRG